MRRTRPSWNICLIPCGGSSLSRSDCTVTRVTCQTEPANCAQMEPRGRNAGHGRDATPNPPRWPLCRRSALMQSPLSGVFANRCPHRPYTPLPALRTSSPHSLLCQTELSKQAFRAARLRFGTSGKMGKIGPFWDTGFDCFQKLSGFPWARLVPREAREWRGAEFTL
jgi:hypothetical protein